MPTICQWFYACTNDAEYRLPHPILGNLPICARCAAIVAQADEVLPLHPVAGLDTEVG